MGLLGLLVLRRRHRECAVKRDPERRWDAIGRAFTFKLASCREIEGQRTTFRSKAQTELRF